jgi:hypothetical protein
MSILSLESMKVEPQRVPMETSAPLDYIKFT